jgi:hypothetical protein
MKKTTPLIEALKIYNQRKGGNDWRVPRSNTHAHEELLTILGKHEKVALLRHTRYQRMIEESTLNL